MHKTAVPSHDPGPLDTVRIVHAWIDMAAIDSLLKLMDAQGADGLVVLADDVPTLEKAGETIQLSMPAVCTR